MPIIIQKNGKCGSPASGSQHTDFCHITLPLTFLCFSKKNFVFCSICKADNICPVSPESQHRQRIPLLCTFLSYDFCPCHSHPSLHARSLRSVPPDNSSENIKKHNVYPKIIQKIRLHREQTVSSQMRSEILPMQQSPCHRGIQALPENYVQARIPQLHK